MKGVSLGVAAILFAEIGVDGGLFAGALTNTPALAAVLDLLRGYGAQRAAAASSAPVVAESATYTLGVLIPIIAIGLAPWSAP